ncbi:hypothetical protein HPP92_019394 [Vanilla planifolia]|uniref:Uncharacterized protein n=1 Tax=Vanilla planifolia TaxID=51239 RepID=A0A835Q2S8_VANPL|nr:hypothetical protein HPP92_019394 [Vanilla planifolia]
MAALSRSRRRPKLILGSNNESSSSSSSEDEEEELEEDPIVEQDVIEDKRDDRWNRKRVPFGGEGLQGRGAPGRIPGCHLHRLPQKPCFLCKMPGHTTMSCPHRVALEHGVIPATRKNKQTPLDYVFERQVKSQVSKIKPTFVIPDKLDLVAVKFHSRRVTSLEFHSTRSNILLSGDKKGQIGIWDYSKPDEKTIYGSIHSCIVNNMKFDLRNDAMLYTASSDGTINHTDIETGISCCLMDLNPNGWNGPATWRMLYGMDTCLEKGLVLVADNFGYLYLLDSREKTQIADAILIHKKGSKVVGLNCNPSQPDLLLSCGNDHFAYMWDIRQLESRSSLVNLAHERVVNSAYFSPQTGSKIPTTSQDNRIRVWDLIFGDLSQPSREIVHSHDFNRHLTPFFSSRVGSKVIGRYISENYDGVALHPIDFIDTTTGRLVAEVIDTDLTTITPVNKLHPCDDILASGSSRSVLIWRPGSKFDGEDQQLERNKVVIYCNDGKKKHSKKIDDGSDEDDGCSSKGKNLQLKCNDVEELIQSK